MLLWLCVTLTSLSWLFAVRLFVTQNPLFRWILIAGAILAALWGLRALSEPTRLPARSLLLLLPGLLALFLAAPPYRAPLLVTLGAGLLPLCVAGPCGEIFAQVGRSGLFVGSILMLQSPVYWLTCAFRARNPEVPFAGRIAGEILRWIGADATCWGDTFTVRTMQAVHRFPCTWTCLGLFPLALLLVGGAFAVWRLSSRQKLLPRLTALVALLLLYAVVRFVLVVAWFITAMLFEEYGSKTVHVELFWLPWITALTFVPAWIFLGRFVPLSVLGAGEAASSTGESVLGFPRALFAALACAGLVLALRFPDPGAAKNGRILLDEAHSRWENTGRAYDTDWYGSQSQYNYWSMAQFLRHYFDLSINEKEPLTAELLKDTSVVILKNPTEPYSAEEIQALVDFVASGGGLFLVGEHTDVFGTSSYLNKVSRRFGILFRPDAVFDIERKWEQVYFPPKLGSHPILQGLPFFRFAVSCSIETRTWKARPVIRATGLWNLPIEYSASNFYPQVEDATYAYSGAFDQMVSVPWGKGRVVAFSDSTLYSNFLAFYPGKPELLLRTMSYLNRRNTFAAKVPLGFVLFLLGIAALLLCGVRRGPSPVFGASTLLWAHAAAWFALLLSAHASRAWYPDPKPVKPVPFITVDLEHSDIELPVFGFVQKHHRSYKIFYQWILRVNAYPRISFQTSEALKRAYPIIMVQPVRPFSDRLLREIEGFLKAGGVVVVLDSPENRESSANDLLNRWGLFFEKKCRGTSLYEAHTGARVCRLPAGRIVRGGTTLLRTAVGEPVAAFARVGGGLIIAGGIAQRFFDPHFGYSTSGVPDREMRAAYELSFALFRSCLSRRPEEEFRALGKALSP